MNFQDAAKAHVEWNVKLRMYIDGQGELDASTVCKDNQCVLGQWIYGEGKAHEALPEYGELRAAHAEFHQIAGDIVKMIDANQKDEAKQALETGGKFRDLSMKIGAMLNNMERKAGAA